MVRAAIVGLGWWGRVLVESVQSDSRLLRFTRGVERNPAAAAGFAGARDIVLGTDLDAVLDDDEIDAVVLATPHSQHVDQIIAVARAGKHVFSEKPLALTLAEARRAVGACADAAVVLGVGTDKRFLPAVRELARLVEDGVLGHVVHVEAQYSNDNSSRALSGPWRTSTTEAPGGGMSGPGLHALDGLIWLAGPLRRVDAQLHTHAISPHPVDAVAANLRFTSGATGSLSTVRAVPEYFRLQVHGTAGWAEVNGPHTLTTSLHGHEPSQHRFAPGSTVGHLLEEFAAAVLGPRPFPVAVASMLNTVAAFEATITSLTAGEPVLVEPSTTAPHPLEKRS